MISIIRILLICPFIIYILEDEYIKGGIILTVSGMSDLLDGFIARNFNQVSKLGRMLDPIADKLTLISVMICIGLKFKEIKIFVIILIIKEVLMILASAFLLKKHKFPPEAKWYGKIATVWFYFSAVVIIALKFIWNIQSNFLTVSFMLITVALMFYAFVKYFQIFVGIIKKR
jgi:cardiolipin synthase